MSAKWIQTVIEKYDELAVIGEIVIWATTRQHLILSKDKGRAVMRSTVKQALLALLGLFASWAILLMAFT
jgi:hypothetical protein